MMIIIINYTTWWNYKNTDTFLKAPVNQILPLPPWPQLKIYDPSHQQQFNQK